MSQWTKSHVHVRLHLHHVQGVHVLGRSGQKTIVYKGTDTKIYSPLQARTKMKAC